MSCDFEGKVALFEHVIWKENSAGAEAKPAENMAGNEPSLVDKTKATASKFDFIIGCDGAHSVLRQCMMRQLDMDFQQSHIDARWCDFIIPPTSDRQYRLTPKRLHLWPDKESMVVAQPDFVSPDRSTHSRHL